MEMVQCTINPDVLKRVAGAKEWVSWALIRGKVTLTILQMGQGRTAEGNKKG